MENFPEDSNFEYNDDNYRLYDHHEYYDYDRLDYEKAEFIVKIVTWIIIAVGLPSNIVTVVTSCCLVRKGHVAPIYVINLLICNLVQLCCMIVFVTSTDWHVPLPAIITFMSSLMATVLFMLCVSMDRYLSVACPLWYGSKPKLLVSVVLCAVVWILVPVTSLSIYFSYRPHIYYSILLMPFLLLIFFLGGTLVALPSSSAPPDEKRRTVATLVLVLLIYTLLYLPYVVRVLANIPGNVFSCVCVILVRFHCVADVILYFFLSKGAVDKCLASVCCCRMESSRSAENVAVASAVSFM